MEVLIIDDGSDDDNKKKLQEYKQTSKLNIRLFYSQSAGPATARNIGFKNAAGLIILIINDDTLVEKDFLERHARFHEEHAELTAALHGPFITHPDIIDSPAMKWLVDKSNMHFDYESIDKLEIIPWNYFWTCNISLKRSFIIDNGLFFDESFAVAAWEDVEYGWRAFDKGLRIYFDKTLVAYHDHYFELKDMLNRFYSHGRGLYTIKGKLPDKHTPPLARTHIRLAARLLMVLTIAPVTVPYLISRLESKTELNNALMQLIVIYKKLQGYDFEKKRTSAE